MVGFQKRTAEHKAATRARYELKLRADAALKHAARLADQSNWKECAACCQAFYCRNRNQACCSKICRQRYEARRRKARLRGLSPVVITVAHLLRRGDRDCGLCGLDVDKLLTYPHPLSATVDHIVPLTRGGAHAIDNTQLAHARCNLSKGNRHVA